MYSYKTKGTCSKEIQFKIEDNKITEINFINGCAGNLLGISHLVKDMPVDDVIEKLGGVPCGFKSTSCPDQLAKALIEWKTSKENH